MIALLRRLLLDESGAAIVEYALVLALVSAAGMAALFAFGNSVQTFFMNFINNWQNSETSGQ